ncbi:MAG: hypothetical protein GY928_23260 [Colwellia sp.]|nr:hypothetical protein [Colwellia sp.]
MKNNIENFKKLELKQGDWFNRLGFTGDQIGVIQNNYPVYQDNTLNSRFCFGILMDEGELVNVNLTHEDEWEDLTGRQYHPCDFFPETTSVSSSEGNPTLEAQTPATEGCGVSEDTIPMYNVRGEHVQDFKLPVEELTLPHLESFILEHNASVQLDQEDGKITYTIYLEENEYKITTKKDLDNLDTALKVIKEMRV